jgi:predicted amino acid dehydrogenase
MQRRADELRQSLLKSIGSDRLPPTCAAAALAEGSAPHESIVVTSDPSPYWSTCAIVITATSALSELVSAANLARGAVICDVSRPMNVAPDLENQRPDVTLIEGGVLVAPPRFDSGFDLGIGRDRAYACMAETMLLALERDTAHATLGSEIDLGVLPWLADAARRAGFSLPEERAQNRRRAPRPHEQTTGLGLDSATATMRKSLR